METDFIKHRSYNGEKARGEAWDQIFACASADNCVVGPRNGRPMVGSNHEAHLNELAGVPRQPAQKTNNTGYDAQGFLQGPLQQLRSRSQPSLEPQQPQSSPQAYFWLEDLGDGHASIDEFLTPLITDTGHKGSRFTDEAQLLRHKKRKVHFSLYNQWFQSNLKPTFVRVKALNPGLDPSILTLAQE